MALVGEAIAAKGGNLGLAGAWMARQLCARLHILGHGSAAQKSAYLPNLAAGLSTPCFAVSEPGAGAHPKHLKTEAVCDGDSYVINGEKAYLTNGPIADLILLLAITGVADGRKQYSIFLVPRETPGIEETEGIKIDFLKPSCHCGMKFNDVRVPAEALLGKATRSRPFLCRCGGSRMRYPPQTRRAHSATRWTVSVLRFRMSNSTRNN